MSTQHQPENLQHGVKTSLKGRHQASRKERQKNSIIKTVREELAKPERRVGRLAERKKAPTAHVAAAMPNTGANAVAGNSGTKGRDPDAVTETPAQYGQAHYVTDPDPTPCRARPRSSWS